jgi:solute carrier family 25 protein 39/40
MAGKKTSEFTYGQTLGVSFMSGAASGGVASLITQPFDVVKTRRQVDQYNLGNNHVHSHGQGQGHGHGEGSHGHGRSHSHGQSQSGAGGGGGGGGKGGGWVGSGGRTTFAGIQRIVAEEGFFGLYAGSLPRMLKVAPACAVMISSYEIGKRVFGRISTAEG